MYKVQTRKRMRISTLARLNGVSSKSILQALSLVNDPYRSASSVIYVDESNSIYWQSILAQAKRYDNLNSETKLKN